MQTIVVNLECEMGDSFRCQKAADSVSLDPGKKSKHNISITVDDFNDYNIGLIVGSSGSGKTTLAKKLFGDSKNLEVDESKPIIDQFPKEMSYEDCADALCGMGLTSIPCWIRPYYTLSNGQKSRAIAALGMANCNKGEVYFIDEWTSVVDRAAAKIMSHCLQKIARKKNLKVVVLSCHYDVTDWLNPDFIIDCNLSTYVNRKQNGEVKAFVRQDCLRFDIKECNSKSWKYFSKYHYLNENLAPDTKFCFGIFNNENQIGFVAFTRYAFKNKKMLHSNRVVIHPDYVGLGLGIKMVDAASYYLNKKGYDIRAKFTSRAMLKHRMRNPEWKLIKKEQVISKSQNAVGEVSTAGKKKKTSQIKNRNSSKSFYVTYYTFVYRPKDF